ncbi:unnamed protein product [Candidula unifasciata]|uniref:Anion exchange protein n=1 Tax=Candidula unifasciata TaxID=100452 RepID=A0A8S3YPR8_9EUPU|nr:unnamed protein product [Candidula unifasciata]
MGDGPNIDTTTMDTLIVSRILESRPKDIVCPMFCQMNQLTDCGYERVWLQVARWVKFQEVLDEDAHRWSKPHVPSISLKALVCLSKELRQAPLLLDPEVTDFYSVIDKIVTSWLQCGFIERHQEEDIKATLRKPIRHVHEYKSLRSVSMGTNLLQIKERGLNISNVSLESAGSVKGQSYILVTKVLHFGMFQKNVKFQRKIPKNAVATNILVGEVPTLRRPLMALVRLNPARHLGCLCEVKLATQFVFVCLSPGAVCGYDVTEIGRCVGTLMIDPIFREVAGHCCNRFEVLAGIREFTSHLTALPSCVWDPTTRIEPPAKLPPQDFRIRSSVAQEDQRTQIEAEKMHLAEAELTRTGKLFGGLIADIKRKVPWYLSDFKDGLHVQCLASTIYLFLATLTPNVTFGGLLGQETDHLMGTMECILAASITGVVYALFSGQPLNILGSTGPMLVMETIIFQFCRDHGWDFMAFRVWIGLWTTLILIVIVAFDLSALVRFITRFTEECFACLIALIFIYEAFTKVISINDQYTVHLGSHSELPACPVLNVTNLTDAPANMTSTVSTIANSTITTTISNITATLPTCHSYVADVFLLSVLEFLFTFGIAFALVRFRSSVFFPNVVRQMLSDFGVLIAILIVVGADVLLKIDTPKLTVPDKFSPTRPDRPWFINPVSDKNPWWLTVAAALPALLATILVFMDQQITAVIVNRKEHKLKKGFGYHLDMLVLAALIAVNSLLGLPWFVAATVSAIAHIMSLKVESDCTAPGEKPEFLGVREQRVTSLLVGVLSGLSVLLTAVLKFIPLPVLYGVFLFMGVRALDGMQLVDRCCLFIISPKYQPDYPYLRHVALYRVHIYTFIQIICLAALWIIKSFIETSIGFPVMVLAICFVRKFLDWLFTQCELSWLDHVLPAMCTQGRDEQQEMSTRLPHGHQQQTHDKGDHNDQTEMTTNAVGVVLHLITVDVSNDVGVDNPNVASLTDEGEIDKCQAVVPHS